MNHKNKNLERLLQQFVDQAQARQMAEDIEYADNLFDTLPAPCLSEEITASLKQKVQNRLTYRKYAPFQWFAAAAAAILLIGTVLLNSNSTKVSKVAINIVPNKSFRAEGFYLVDKADVEIENELSDLSHAVDEIDATPYEPVNTLQIDLNQIENELVAYNDEFWKG